MSTPDFDPNADVLGLVEALGIDTTPTVATAPAHPEANVRFIAHPSYAREFTNLALELLLTEWGKELEDLSADTPIPYTVVVDHDECAGGCGRTVCHCPLERCADTVEQGPCTHGWRLCDECRHHCAECRDDAVDDYIDGDDR